MKSVLAAFGPAVASLFVVPAALAAAAPPLASFPVDAQVATVNGESIAISDVMRELPATLRSPAFANAGAMPEEALFRAAFREALDTLVDRALVLQRYWAGDQRLPAHAIDKTVAEIIEDRYGGNLQNLLEDLAAERMTYAEWRDRMQERLIVASMRHGFADGLAYVSPSEISEEYERRKPEFARKDRVKVLVAAFSGAGAATDAAVTADAVAASPDPAAAFAGLASGGGAVSVQDMGFIDPAEDLAPALAAAVAETADGAVSKPVELGESVFLAFRAESENSGAKPLSEVWDELRKGLIAKKKAELFKAWIGHLRADAVIVETLPWDDENGGETQPSEQNDGDRT